jgi:hypothetical protein
MSDNPNPNYNGTNDTGDTDGDVDGATDFTPASYEIDPEDHHLAVEIANMDPLSLPGANSHVGVEKLSATLPTVEGLPDAMRQAVEAELKGVPQSRRKEAEQAAVLKALQENSLAQRSKSGFAASVPDFWHEYASIARDHDDALAEFDKLALQMGEVARWEKDANGNPVAVPVMGQENMRKAALRQADLLRRADLLKTRDGNLGFEAKRRLAKAMRDSVARLKQQRAQAAIHAAAQKRADEMLHDEAVEELAKAFAKHKRGS